VASLFSSKTPISLEKPPLFALPTLIFQLHPPNLRLQTRDFQLQNRLM
jgi:hypothetical protein